MRGDRNAGDRVGETPGGQIRLAAPGPWAGSTAFYNHAGLLPQISWYLTTPLCLPHSIFLIWAAPSLLFKDFIYLFREGEGGGREGAKYQCVCRASSS